MRVLNLRRWTSTISWGRRLIYPWELLRSLIWSISFVVLVGLRTYSWLSSIQAVASWPYHISSRNLRRQSTSASVEALHSRHLRSCILGSNYTKPCRFDLRRIYRRLRMSTSMFRSVSKPPRLWDVLRDAIAALAQSTDGFAG